MRTPKETYTFASQSIGLPSVANARELGGIVLPDGRRVRHGLLLRGGNLSVASKDDLLRLRTAFPLTHDFDFRTEAEVTIAPDPPLPGIRFVWLPAIDPDTEKPGISALPQDAYRHLDVWLIENAQDEMVQRVARRLYNDMVVNEYTQLQYAAFLQMVTAAEGAVYWHCSQGKDRTGLAAAFLLAALGADRETIMADYEISNDYYHDITARIIQEVRARSGNDDAVAVIQTFIGVNPEYFSGALDLIDKKYGSMQNYLTNQLLLSENDMARLRDRLLE